MKIAIIETTAPPEIKKYLANEYTLEECIIKGQQVTRNYVKRQHTWWNSSNLEILISHFQFLPP